MKAILAGVAALGLTLAACENAPDDGTSEDPTAEVPATESEAPLDPTVPDEPPVTTPQNDGTTAVEYDGPIPRPIPIGSLGPDGDACGIVGEVRGLERVGAEYLSVRDAPSSATKERDRLSEGQSVTVCTSANGWFGVVYDKGDAQRDCGVSSPVPSERNYLGPCAQGWVEMRYITVVAG